jgi:hypothetical protein
MSGPSVIPATHPDIEVALEAERDITELAFIFDNAEAFAGSTEFEFQLGLALKDAVLPQDNAGQSPGRDAQFHLYVAAICQKAGMSPAFAEPDLVCNVDGVQFGVAAKRLKNIERLEERFKSARDQIDKARLPGIVALELSVAWNRQNVRLPVSGHEDEFAALFSQSLKKFADDNIETLRRLSRGSDVRGVIIHTTHIWDAKDGDTCAIGFSYGIPTVQFNRRREMEFYRFKARYDLGLDRRQNKPFRPPKRARW